MTIESRIPLKEVRKALNWYDELYWTISNPKRAYVYKVNVARNTILSILFSIVKIGLLIGCICWTVYAFDVHWELTAIPLILSFVFGISIFLDLFYLEKIPEKKLPKLRLRIVHFFFCIAKDIYEFSVFKKRFSLSIPSFLLMLGIGEKKALANIEDWGYYRAQRQLDNISEYKNKYSNYRDYVDLGQHWDVAGELLALLDSGRATDIASALAVRDFKKSREKVERIAQDEAARVKAAADRMESAAKEVEEAARAEKEFYKNA